MHVINSSVVIEVDTYFRNQIDTLLAINVSDSSPKMTLLVEPHLISDSLIPVPTNSIALVSSTSKLSYICLTIYLLPL